LTVLKIPKLKETLRKPDLALYLGK